MARVKMSEIKAQLFAAFREDHAVFGRGLYDLGQNLRARDLAGAIAAADALDQTSGAHIAFEEHDFYPALAAFLSTEEVDELYSDHAKASRIIPDVKTLSDQALQDDATRSQLIARVEAMQHHVSECGELFGALGGLSPRQHEQLLERLSMWRKKAPRWTECPPAPQRHGDS